MSGRNKAITTELQLAIELAKVGRKKVYSASDRKIIGRERKARQRAGQAPTNDWAKLLKKGKSDDAAKADKAKGRDAKAEDIRTDQKKGGTNHPKEANPDKVKQTGKITKADADRSTVVAKNFPEATSRDTDKPGIPLIKDAKDRGGKKRPDVRDMRSVDSKSKQDKLLQSYGYDPKNKKEFEDARKLEFAPPSFQDVNIPKETYKDSTRGGTSKGRQAKSKRVFKKKLKG